MTTQIEKLKKVMTIPLKHGQFAIIDADDFERVNQWEWSLMQATTNPNRFYARRILREGKKVRVIYLHRFILNAPKGLEVDHKNGNGLDNRRSNIRLATQSQNSGNRVARSKCGFKGVCFNKYKQKFMATVQADKKRYFCGYHTSAETAAKAYDQKAKEVFGEFALLNFPEIQNSEVSK